MESKLTSIGYALIEFQNSFNSTDIIVGFKFSLCVNLLFYFASVVTCVFLVLTKQYYSKYNISWKDELVSQILNSGYMLLLVAGASFFSTVLCYRTTVTSHIIFSAIWFLTIIGIIFALFLLEKFRLKYKMSRRFTLLVPKICTLLTSLGFISWVWNGAMLK